MKRFLIEVKYVTPLLHHRMNEEAIAGLLGDKGKKKKVKEVLTPREIAAKHVYEDKDGTCYIPSGYFCGAFSHVASDYHQKNSQRKSYKSIAGGIFRPETENITLLDEKNKPIKKWEVDMRKGTNHLKGAVAICRPRFEKWKCKFVAQINTDLISEDIALKILEDAGVRAGIGSFRVAKGGWFGQFVITKFQEVKS